MNFGGIPQFLAGGLTMGAVYALVGVGFSLIYSSSRVINFAQGEFVVLGGLLAYSLAGPVGWPVSVVILVTLLAMTACGMVLHEVVNLRGQGRDPLTYIIITLAVSFILRGLAQQIWGTDFRTFSLYPDTVFEVAGARVSASTLIVLAVTALVSGGLWAFFGRTMIGRAFRACAADESAARTLGIRPRRMTMLAYATSGLVGGLAGVLLTPIILMSYDRGVLLALKGFTAAVVGGLGNPFGALFGGLLLGALEALGVGLISSELQDAYVFLTLALVLAFRPQGLAVRRTVLS